MGRFVFKLPDVGEGTAEAELVAWHVKLGDTVSEDQILADVMTDKATVEITSPVSGVVVALHGEPGVAQAVGGLGPRPLERRRPKRLRPRPPPKPSPRAPRANARLPRRR